MKIESRNSAWSAALPLTGIAFCLALTALSASRAFGGDNLLFREAGRLCLATFGMLVPHLHHIEQALAVVLLPGFLTAAAFLGSLLFLLVRQAVRTRSFVEGLLSHETYERSGKLTSAMQRAGLDARIRLISSWQFHCFCFGLLRPQVCLSTAVVNQLSAAELEAVLRHEAWHVRHRDPLRILLANSMGSLVLFARAWATSRRIEHELKADAATVREMGDKLPLASALLKAIQASPTPSFEFTAGAFGALDARIDQLMHEPAEDQPARRLSRKRILISVAEGAALFGLVCLLMTASSAAVGAVCLDC